MGQMQSAQLRRRPRGNARSERTETSLDLRLEGRDPQEAENHMKILLVHNHYQRPGGEDAGAAREARLLAEHGHAVIEYRRHNDELQGRSILGIGVAAGCAVWSTASYRALRELLACEKPAVAHFHNTFPLISPAAYHACAEAGVPVVQSLHNFRLLCPGASLYREGRVCEDCLHKRLKWPGIVHGCYRGSRLATAAVGTMIAVHHGLGTWEQKVTRYIAFCEFSRRKLIEGGLPAERITVKPVFVHPDPKPKNELGSYALYLGRLTEEKGLRVLLGAWGMLGSCIPLRIAGDGPMRQEIAAEIEAKGLQNVELLGHVSPSEVVTLMHGARFLVVPSQWYENFPGNIAEAFACRLPPIASRLGTMAEIIADGENGLHFTPGDAGELAEKVEWAWTHPAEMETMGRAARAEYEARYTAERNYPMLMEIYRKALGAGCLRLGAGDWRLRTKT